MVYVEGRGILRLDAIECGCPPARRDPASRADLRWGGCLLNQDLLPGVAPITIGITRMSEEVSVITGTQLRAHLERCQGRQCTASPRRWLCCGRFLVTEERTCRDDRDLLASSN